MPIQSLALPVHSLSLALCHHSLSTLCLSRSAIRLPHYSLSLHQSSLVPAAADYRYSPLPLKSFLMLVNVRLRFVWDFDYFVET